MVYTVNDQFKVILPGITSTPIERNKASTERVVINYLFYFLPKSFRFVNKTVLYL